MCSSQLLASIYFYLLVRSALARCASNDTTRGGLTRCQGNKPAIRRLLLLDSLLEDDHDAALFIHTKCITCSMATPILSFYFIPSVENNGIILRWIRRATCHVAGPGLWSVRVSQADRPSDLTWFPIVFPATHAPQGHCQWAPC